MTIELTGLRGDSFLGFLAALGVCRLLNGRLWWAREGPVWIAHIDSALDRESLVEELVRSCKQLPGPLLADPPLDPAFKVDSERWKEFAKGDEGWACALGSDAGAEFYRSPLLMSSGGGRQHPLVMVQNLVERIDAEDVAGAVFGPWVRRSKFGLRLDPMEYRSHADQWTDPSESATAAGVVPWGATRLAFEGFPLAPVLKRRVHPLLDANRDFSWPLWERPLSPRAVTAKLHTAKPWFVAPRKHFSFSKGNWSIFPSRPVKRV